MSPDGITLAVRTYSEIFFYAAENGPSTALGQPQGHRWRDLKRPCFLGETEPQGEAIDFLDEKTLVLAPKPHKADAGCFIASNARSVRLQPDWIRYAARERKRASTGAQISSCGADIQQRFHRKKPSCVPGRRHSKGVIQ